MVPPNTKATLRLTFVLAAVPSLAFEGTRIPNHMLCTPAAGGGGVNLNYRNHHHHHRCFLRRNYYHRQEEEESWIRKRKNVRWTSSHLYAERFTDEEQQQQQQQQQQPLREVPNGIISATACAEKSHLSSDVLPTNVKTEDEDQDDDDEEEEESTTKGLSLEYNIQSSFNLPYSKEIRAFLSQPLVELNFCILVLVSSFLVALGTLPTGTLSEVGFDLIDAAENVVVAIFTLEFFARWYSFGQFTGRYLKKPLAIIDVFVVVLPFTLRMFPTISIMLPPILSSNSGLITLTLLRVLRLQRILKDMDTFSQIQVAIGLEKRDVRPYQLEIAKVVVTIFTLLSVSSGLIYTFEHNVNPAIPDYFTALYFGLTTLTTVGFGDIAPGKVIEVIINLLIVIKLYSSLTNISLQLRLLAV